MSGGAHSFTHDDVQRILEVVDRLDDVEIEIETGDLKLHVRKFAEGRAPRADGTRGALAANGPAAAPTAAPAAARDVPAARAEPAPAAPAATAARGAAPSATAVPVRAPMLGTFYRSAAPTEPPYVEAGREVRATDPVCIIEVMKLFNTVEAGVDGTVVRVDCENGAMVEYDQPLFWIEPR